MRPDQHKKKKNSEYKKKHNISSEKDEKHDKKGSTGKHRSEESQERPASDEPKAGLETDDADGEDQNSSHERGNFSRRKIESNCDRYKEDDFGFEEESEVNSASPVSSVPIGADFQSLLDKATSSSSHFQFKSEKEWEDIHTDETNNKAGPSLLVIDCHALAQSLRNIPLEQRLDIDKKYSIEDDEYRGSNTNKSQLNKPETNHQINDRETTNISSGKLGQTVHNHMNFAFSQPGKPTKASKGNEKEQYPTVHELKSPEEQKSKDLSADVESNMEKVQHNASSTKPVEEDDLDLLLGIDNNKELNSLHSGNQTGALDIQASGSTNKVDVTTATQKPQPAGDTKEDLEDWLDSILD